MLDSERWDSCGIHADAISFRCWTCKKRKVKCDERPIECGNCVKMGIKCGGYGIRLRWRDDGGTGPSAASLEGRGTIGLG